MTWRARPYTAPPAWGGPGGDRRRRRRRRFYARPFAHALGATFEHRAYFRISVAWGGLSVAAAAALALVRDARVRNGLLALLVAVETIVLFAVPEFSAPRATTVDLAPVTYLRQHLGEGRFFTLGPISPDYGSYFGLASIAVDDFPPKAYAAYVRTRLDPVVAFTGFRPEGTAIGPAGVDASPRRLSVRRLCATCSRRPGSRCRRVRPHSGSCSAARPPGSTSSRGRRPTSSAPGCQVTSSDRDRARRSPARGRRPSSAARPGSRAGAPLVDGQPDADPPRRRPLPGRRRAAGTPPHHVQLRAAGDGLGRASACSWAAR